MKPTIEQTKKIERMVRKCMNLLKKKDYPIDIGKEDVDRAVRLTRVVDKQWAAGATYAKGRAMQFNLSYWQLRSDQWDDGWMREYRAFQKNKIYGNREVTDLDDRLLVLVAHEVAHHVQRNNIKQSTGRKGCWGKSHGEGFQRIYRWLRNDLVNPIIDQKIKDKKASETKAEKFKRLAEARVNKTIKQIRLITNLSNTSHYSWTEEDAEKIYKTLRKELRLQLNRFKESTPTHPAFKKKSFSLN